MAKKDDTSAAAALKILNELDEFGSLLPLECTRDEHYERTDEDINKYRAFFEKLKRLKNKSKRVKDMIKSLRYDLSVVRSY